MLESVTTQTLQDEVLVVLEILVLSHLAGEFFGKAEEWMERLRQLSLLSQELHFLDSNVQRHTEIQYTV